MKLCWKGTGPLTVDCISHPQGEVTLIPGMNVVADKIGAEVLAVAVTNVRAGLLYEQTDDLLVDDNQNFIVDEKGNGIVVAE